jgi:putative DNA primase/helicase
MDVTAQFCDALRARHIIPPDNNLLADGAIHRCDADGPNGKGDAANLLHLDGIPAGGFENHRDSLGWESWRANIGRQLSPAEMLAHRDRIEANKRIAEAVTAQRRKDAREQAATIWARSEPAPADHPYLVAKGVKAHGPTVT